VVEYTFDSNSEPDIDSDLDIEGSYVAPDSHEFTVAGRAAGTAVDLEVVIIDDEAWIREPGGDWTPRTRTEVESLTFASTANASFLEQYPEFLEALADLDGESDTVGGRDAVRYDQAGESASAFMRVFGTSSDNLQLGDIEDLTIWIDEETGHLLRASFSATGENVDLPGDSVAITIDVEISDVDEESIEIEPPI
jgi:hypothetical protein